MTKILSYSFSLTPPPKPRQEEQLHEYSYSEFRLALGSEWRLVPTATEDSISFHSESAGAGITVSADLYDIPDAKAQAMAAKNIASRIEGLEAMNPGQVNVLRQSIEPHSGGVGLELTLAAELPGKYVYLFLGYVTSRKVLNFTMVCRPDRPAAAALFNKTIENFRPKLP
jgi:hypothetical protein